ncbi:MAG: FKBP-type peptidyl-prolyl cis-trans isomerase [Acidobacteria bacterium]|nr:FKBP-type peptidyl-prolyl cis-trans isomerase [Acidobacteriota bacterium]
MSRWCCFATGPLLVALIVSAGCGGGDTPSSPSMPGAPFSQTDLRAGTGAEAVAGRTLTVHYTGWLYSPTQPEQKGQQFDSSAGRAPFTFVVGAGRVIAGWDRGVVGMRVGGLRRLIIPPDLAYGSQGTAGIPPNSTLVFDVELLDVQ